MDPQLFQVIVGLISIMLAVLGTAVIWWVNTIWRMVTAQQQQIAALSLKLAEGYVPRAELEKTFERIFRLLEEIQKEVRHA